MHAVEGQIDALGTTFSFALTDENHVYIRSNDFADVPDPPPIINGVPFNVSIHLYRGERADGWSMSDPSDLHLSRNNVFSEPSESARRKAAAALQRAWEEHVTEDLLLRAKRYRLDSEISKTQTEITKTIATLEELQKKALDLMIERNKLPTPARTT